MKKSEEVFLGREISRSRDYSDEISQIIDQENTRETIISPLSGAENPYIQTEEMKEVKPEELEN